MAEVVGAIQIDISAKTKGFENAIDKINSKMNSAKKSVDKFSIVVSGLHGIFSKLVQSIGRIKFEFLGLGFLFMMIGNSLASFGRGALDVFQQVTGGSTALGIAMTNLQAKFTLLQFVLVNALSPALIFIIDQIIKLIDWFTNLPEPMQQAIGMFILLGTAFAIIASPLAFMILGLFSLIAVLTAPISLLTTLIGGFAALAVSLGLATTGIPAIIAGIGLLIASLILLPLLLLNIAVIFIPMLIAAFLYLIGLGGILYAAFKDKLGAISDWLIGTFVPMVINGFMVFSMSIIKILSFFFKQGEQFWADHGDKILKIANILFKFLERSFNAFVIIATAIMTLFFAIITPLWNLFGKDIIATMKRIFNVILDLIQIFVSLATGDFNGLIDGIKSLFVDTFDFIISIINNAIERIKEVIKLAQDAVGTVGKVGGGIIGKGAKMLGFQAGGIVPNTGPAFLHAGETILPTGVSPINIGDIIINTTGGTSTPFDQEMLANRVIEKIRQEMIAYGARG